jgi:hypothetical protein
MKGGGIIARMASHFSGGKSCNGATCWIPALLTRISSRPEFRSVFSIISRIAAGFDMSAGEKDTRTLNSEAIFVCTSATSSGLPKPLRTISESAAAKARAMPSPMPLVEPVTSDTLPASASRLLRFSGLMAMFMAHPRVWKHLAAPVIFCPSQAMQRQCLLANELIQSSYGHRMNCELAGCADHILMEKRVTCTPTYWSERDDWTLAMVAAGLGFAFMPENAANPGVVALPVIEPEFWRTVNLVTVRGHRYSPGLVHWHGRPCAKSGSARKRLQRRWRS